MSSSPLTSLPSSSPPGTPSPKGQSEIPEGPSTPSDKRTGKESYLNTPTARTEDSTKDTLMENQAAQRYERLARDIQSHLVGPMPLDMFFEKFLPKAKNPNKPSSKGAFKKVAPQGKENDLKERDLNVPLAEALNGDKDKPRCPGITFFHTGDRAEDTTGSKIDICGYLDGDGNNTSMPGFIQTFLEIKLIDFACDDPKKDPKNPDKEPEFTFSHIHNKTDLERAQQGLGQQVSYATEVCARQHRNFLFSIFITPTIARFLRWDRSGVVISASFNYKSKPEILCDFLWRFGNMTHEERGGDTSVRRASADEEAIFAEAIRTHVKAQLGNDYKKLDDEVDRHYQLGVVIKIPVRKSMRVKRVSTDAEADPESDNAFAVGETIRTADTERQGGERTGLEAKNNIEATGGEAPARKAEVKETVEFDSEAEKIEFLVSRPIVSPLSLASRGTRGYWAVHVENKTVHFLKDAWRTAVEELEVEGRILEKLAAGKVRNIPTVLCWSDVGPQDNPAYRTETALYKGSTDWNKHWRSEEKFKLVRLTHRVHYRQVTKEAGHTLKQMAGTLELLRGARDVFQALRDASSICNRLHRDVSASNIILYADEGHIYSERRAILADWELSCEDIPGPARDHWLSGTWAFMSISTLQGTRPHHISDDIESLIYVVFYCAIHFLPWTNSYNVDSHLGLIVSFFNDYPVGGNTGGDGKMANAAFAKYFKLANFEHVSTWLNHTLKHVHRFCREEEPPEAADMVIEIYNPLFEHPPTYYIDLRKDNRDPHKLRYKGPNLEIHHGTTISSPAVREKLAPGTSAPPNDVFSSDYSSTTGNLKRDVSSVDNPDAGSSSKRRKANSLPIAGPSKSKKPLPRK